MRQLLACLLVFGLFLNPTHAGPISENAAEAEKLAKSGAPEEALAKFHAAEDAFWQAIPLTVVNLKHVRSAGGFGIYAERPDHVYKPDEKIMLYMEPVGFSYGSDGLGNNTIALSVDSALYSSSGKKIGSSKTISQVNAATRAKNREIFLNLGISPNEEKLPAGRYRVELILTDNNSSKSVTFSTDFEISQSL